MEKHLPDTLEYCENGQARKIGGKSFEEWGDFVCEKEAKRLNEIETCKVQQAFFAMDYSHRFTGRGGRLSPCAHDV